MVLEKNFEMLEMVNKTVFKAQGYVSFLLDSGEFCCIVIAWVFPNLGSEMIWGTPWLMKENSIIDWVKLEVMLCQCYIEWSKI